MLILDGKTKLDRDCITFGPDLGCSPWMWAHRALKISTLAHPWHFLPDHSSRLQLWGTSDPRWSLAPLRQAALLGCGGGFDIIKGPGRLRLPGGVWVGGVVWTSGSSLLSNDPLLVGNCCLGSYSSLCSFQEPVVMIKVVPNLAVP